MAMRSLPSLVEALQQARGLQAVGWPLAVTVGSIARDVSVLASRGGDCSTPTLTASYATNPSTGKGFVKTAVKKKTRGQGELDQRLQQVIEMLTPPEPKDLQETKEEAEEARKRTEAYLRRKILAEGTWGHDMYVKHKLQRAALMALPPDLKAKAQELDLSPFPPNRHFLFDTPPVSYLAEDKKETSQQNKQTSQQTKQAAGKKG